MVPKPFVIAAIATAVCAAPGLAQQKKPCKSICQPTLVGSVSAVRSHLFNSPTVRSLKDGTTHKLPANTNTQLQLYVFAPTLVPRTEIFVSAQWLPTAKATQNPFTQYTASELSTDEVTANLPSVSMGLRVNVVKPDQTAGWVGLIPYAGDLFSKAQRPDDMSDYTHKLDLGATLTLSVFNWLSPHDWLSKVIGAATLDYVATGQPHAGDEVPKGERVFVDSVHSPTLIVSLVIPVAPLVPK
jgi:hypothetical protein